MIASKDQVSAGVGVQGSQALGYWMFSLPANAQGDQSSR